MKNFNPAQLEFLKTISMQESERDWLDIPCFTEIVEEKKNGKIIGLAGVTKRYFLIPSLFIAVLESERGSGLASRLLDSLLKKHKGILFLTYCRKKPYLKEFYSKSGFKKLIPWFGQRVLCIKL